MCVCVCVCELMYGMKYFHVGIRLVKKDLKILLGNISEEPMYVHSLCVLACMDILYIYNMVLINLLYEI